MICETEFAKLEIEFPNVDVEKVIEKIKEQKIKVTSPLSVIRYRCKKDAHLYKKQPKEITYKDVYAIMRQERPDLLCNIVAQAVYDQDLFDAEAEPERFLAVCRKWKMSNEFSREFNEKKIRQQKEEIIEMEKVEAVKCPAHVEDLIKGLFSHVINEKEQEVDVSSCSIHEARAIAEKSGKYVKKKSDVFSLKKIMQGVMKNGR